MPTTVTSPAPTGPCHAVCDPELCPDARTCVCGQVACLEHGYSDEHCVDFGPMHAECHSENCRQPECWADPR